MPIFANPPESFGATALGHFRRNEFDLPRRKIAARAQRHDVEHMVGHQAGQAEGRADFLHTSWVNSTPAAASITKEASV